MNKKWFVCWLTYSGDMACQVYRFQCRSCGQLQDRNSDYGFDPPSCCTKCGATDAAKPKPADAGKE